MAMDNGQQTPADTGPGVSEAARRVRSDIGAFSTAINQHGVDLVRSMERAIVNRPLAAVVIAFGVGYVLGGGLFSRTTGRVLGAGLRIGGLALARGLFAPSSEPL